MNRLLRPTMLPHWRTAASGSVAHANVEIGGTAGIHVFSTTNELGVPDVNDAPSERNSALFGLRLGCMFTDMLGIEGEFGVIPSEARVGRFRRLEHHVSRSPHRAVRRVGSGQEARSRSCSPAAARSQVVKSKNEDVIAKDTDAALYVGVGAKYRVDNGWGLRADARVLFPPSATGSGPTVDFEALLSIYKEFGRKTVEKAVEPPSGPNDDPDGDGISDDADKCPNEPEDKDGFQDDDGCPDPDNDGDGVARRAGQVPDASPRTRTASRTTTAAPTRTTTATASRTRPTSARTSPRTRTASRTTTAARIRTTTATACSDARTSARSAGDEERLPGRRRLPRRDPGEGEAVHRRHPGHQLQVERGGPPAGVEQDARQGRRGPQGVPGPQARDRGPHR